ncbi:MAG: HEAT repeat domain-containing protein [Promethearchaeota archaeon]|nr:MAG: HEAT repeat domain-containing protein [Candidatus Lokiarchaeota archaeon]
MTIDNSIFKDLDKMGKHEAIEKLHTLYSAVEDTITRIKILQKLNELQDSTHFEEIENYFISDEDSDVRIEAAKLLAFNYNTKRAKAIKPLIWVLENEKKNEIKSTAIRLLVPLALRKEYRNTIIPSFKNILQTKEDYLKMEIAEALGFLKENSAADDLVEMLKSTNNQVRIKAIEALNNLNIFPKTAIPYLLNNLGLESYDIWRFSFNILKNKLGEKQFLQHLLKILEDTKKNNDTLSVGYLRRGIIRALGEIGNKKAIPSLIHSLKDWHDWVREEAIKALNIIDPNWKIHYRSLLKKNNINLK